MAEFRWYPTSAPPVPKNQGARYDDIWFATPEIGWAVNATGEIRHTTDGGKSWVTQFQTPLVPAQSESMQGAKRPVYLRCCTFVGLELGWVGTLSTEQRMYQTTDGHTWGPVDNLPPGAPERLCGIHAVDDRTIWASGTNDPSDQSPGVLHTTNGGKSWIAKDLSEQASNLIDVYFATPERGWVVGGYTDDPKPTYDNVRPVILYTEDAGGSWHNLIPDLGPTFPAGSWGWKIFFVDEQLVYVSIENFDQAWILKSIDGGMSWNKIAVDGNEDLEGIGFLDEQHGWVGGWGKKFTTGNTSLTINGGKSWKDVTHQSHDGFDFELKFLNRVRVLRDPGGALDVAYASGHTVYKYTDQPPPKSPSTLERAAGPRLMAADLPAHGSGSYTFRYTLPAGQGSCHLHIWNRFGILQRTLVAEDGPAAGEHTVTWDGKDDAGRPVRAGAYIYRLTVGRDAESGVFSLDHTNR